MKLILISFFTVFLSIAHVVFAGKIVSTPMPQHEKEGFLQEFSLYDSAESAKSDSASDISAPSKRYDISIYFMNDKFFDMEYYGYSDYPEIPKEKLDGFKKEVFDYYLGDSYESFNPVLKVVIKDRVGIQLTVSPEELTGFISDNRISALINNVTEELIEWN